MPIHAVVTGGAGYLGSILCEHLLDAGHRVTAIDSLTFGQPSLFHLCGNPNFDFVFGDVRDRGLMVRLTKEADVIIPLAAMVGARACSGNPWDTKSVNLDAIKMLNEIRSPQQLVIFPTTNRVYGIQSGEVSCTEETHLEPISLYGQTKVHAERVLLDSPNAITLRLATVFGISPRMRIDLLVNHFTYAALKDGYIVIFEKDLKRNYIHVRDVADCFVHCIENADRMIGRPFNAGLDAAGLSKEELALKIKEYLPNFYVHFGENGHHPDKRNCIVSNRRLGEAGFVARRSLDEGIRELLKGYSTLGRGQFKSF